MRVNEAFSLSVPNTTPLMWETKYEKINNNNLHPHLHEMFKGFWKRGNDACEKKLVKVSELEREAWENKYQEKLSVEWQKLSEQKGGWMVQGGSGPVAGVCNVTIAI